MAPHTLVDAPLTAFVVAAGLALTTPAALAQGKGPGGGGGGHTTASTNLSYPAVFTGTAPTLNGTEGGWTLTGTLGLEWSYGCAIVVEEFPNTSCINADGTFMDYNTCLAYCGGVTPERIYWQRESPRAVWQAKSLATTDAGGSTTWAATHVDWGDNMESQTWTTTSVIRVETTTFATLPEPTLQLGFQMWHVSGKGPDELWGVHATEPPTGEEPLPYVYNSPYAIIHAPNAHISFTKLQPGSATCPTTLTPTPVTPVWNATSQVWTAADGSALCTWNDLAYTMELNIGGRFVHGYNWQTSRVPVAPCQGYVKEGWWRLTYHNVGTALIFGAGVSTTPPVLPEAGPPLTLSAVTEEEGDTGPLYAPTVDPLNNLTYIDICLRPGRGGGGRR